MGAGECGYGGSLNLNGTEEPFFGDLKEKGAFWIKKNVKKDQDEGIESEEDGDWGGEWAGKLQVLQKMLLNYR